MDACEVYLWGTQVASVLWDEKKHVGIFEYSPDILSMGVELSPITMPLRDAPYSFEHLNKDTYEGLPGLIKDSLPDKYGHQIINQWLLKNDRPLNSLSPIEKLCFVGKRGMGALEYRPAIRKDQQRKPTDIDVNALATLADQILNDRTQAEAQIDSSNMTDIIQVGCSAGGARAKAVIAWNKTTNTIRSGQVPADDGFEYYLLKFDHVDNRDKEEKDAKGYTKIEYAYHLMAREAGINMMDCELLSIDGMDHFVTKRFDRSKDGDKLHHQTLCGLAHYDFNNPTYEYDHVFQTIKELNLNMDTMIEQYKRMAFNIIGRNHDDHTKNVGFLMGRDGQWALSPAYDIVFNYKPGGQWTSVYQMGMNGKKDDFILSDFEAIAKRWRIPKWKDLVADVQSALCQWPDLAEKARVPEPRVEYVKQNLRTHILA